MSCDNCQKIINKLNIFTDKYTLNEVGNKIKICVKIDKYPDNKTPAFERPHKPAKSDLELELEYCENSETWVVSADHPNQK